VDVKATKWGGNNGDSWCLLKEQYAGKADGYVVAYVPEGGTKVVLKGWLSDDELCTEENREESPYGHYNYQVKDESQYHNMPEPDANRGMVI